MDLRSAALMIFALIAACERRRDPPPSLSLDGLPVSGSLTDAKRAGFTWCIDLGASMRCRRNGVMLEGQGPFSAAVDFGASDGNGGFDQLTLWHDTDQQAVQSITDALKHQGWFECFTKGGQDWADQAIYTHKGSRVFVSMDISFWGKRRLRVIPSWRKSEARC